MCINIMPVTCFSFINCLSVCLHKHVMNFITSLPGEVVVYTLVLGNMYETTPQGGIELFDKLLPRQHHCRTAIVGLMFPR